MIIFVRTLGWKFLSVPQCFVHGNVRTRVAPMPVRLASLKLFDCALPQIKGRSLSRKEAPVLLLSFLGIGGNFNFD